MVIGERVGEDILSGEGSTLIGEIDGDCIDWRFELGFGVSGLQSFAKVSSVFLVGVSDREKRIGDGVELLVGGFWV